MSATLIIGSSVGAVIGAVHAWSLLRPSASGAPTEAATRGRYGRVAGVYYGLWAVVLWTLFGSYVLYLWLLGAGLYGCRLVVRRLVAISSPGAS